MLNDMTRGCIADEHDAHAHHWGAYDGDSLVASARLCFHDDFESAPDGHLFSGLPIPLPTASLNRLIVSRSHRRRGLGTQLDSARIMFARQSHAKSVIATPVQDEDRIVSLARLGFVTTGKRGITSWSAAVAIVAMYLTF
jgi:predicted GNAT family N-acyltransferase